MREFTHFDSDLFAPTIELFNIVNVKIFELLVFINLPVVVVLESVLEHSFFVEIGFRSKES